MPLPPTNFQPYDRVTGTELSPQQQSACRPYYFIIKAYIDGFQAGAGVPIPWIRKSLSYSTAELLESIEHLADDIRQNKRKDLADNDGTSSIQSWAEAEGRTLPVLDPEGINAASERYQHAVNLLHEFVGRLARGNDYTDVSSRLTEPHSQGHSGPGRLGGASNTSTGPGNTQSTHYRAGALPALAPANSDGASRSDDSWGKGIAEVAHKSNTGVAVRSPQIDDRPSSAKWKSKATSDWALEYLRGGWYSRSPASATEAFHTPVSPLSQETSPGNSFGLLQRTDSENSTFNGDSAAILTRAVSAGVRIKRQGHSIPRAIPTMASRFKSKVSFDIPDANDEESPASAIDFFKTPRSILSGATVFATPDVGPDDPYKITPEITSTSVWNRYLRQKGLIPDPFEEMNWSGRGQHAEFGVAEEDTIPLEHEKNLGHSGTALVDSVRCRRIRLARKTVHVSRRLKKEEALQEVEHLQRLKHSHIVRIVGTYTLPRTLSILLYPVADYTLDVFLESIADNLSAEERAVRLYSTSTFLRCLAKAVAYIHENLMKHMDIKPKNLLVRDMNSSTVCNQGKFKIYVADFGIARSYRSFDDANTETPIAYTKMYAAPEVIAQERRDQKADIFSLGAVYAEMLSVLALPYTEDFPYNYDFLHSIRESHPVDPSYATHATTIQQFVRNLYLTSYGFESDTIHSHITELVALMLSPDPTQRPTAATIVENIPFLAFCCDVNGGPEPFEAADPPKDRQLYDRAMEIAEADERYWRCSVEGCVKVYSSREKLEYHNLNGHGEANFEPRDEGVTFVSEDHTADHYPRNDWSTF
ncbi:kinase-like protein [Bimuria novae-zelandiae CBS 107.79]|uniref:Kinase-like protein n=1 Tax=Bimuria novae-zelandiae CBS 107.79 TaxID=1447943 RepID=A0A6A5V1M4_9PLEO|nr:kinase-like protein [Bimuria novae-zelandiae CBS 107.79]